ncbi:MAG: hypothetical protein OH338_04405 [Candidatus Parvarchaeota archaeon]|nr:hypothetical protein [Candidatus Parvarchaeum tengchongense]MCW1299571.1 hypothetical protein [Candidatus Parvarchaeum tengchongense]MCW1312639.1 hypothetical protein [Candidatus Parvarchaeum tengchongense]
MTKKSSDIEKLLKSLPYKSDADGNPTLKKEFVRNSNYFSDFGLAVNERYIADTFPKVKSREYLQFNNLYNTGFFDDYFARQYKLLNDLYTVKPDNFPKPVALIVDDSAKRVGYITMPFDGNEKRNYIPKAVSLQDYLDNYRSWDEKLIAEKISRVTSLQDLIPRDELNNFILKKGIKRLSYGERYLKEYAARIDVYKNRMEELKDIKKQINDTVKYINQNGLSHNNLYLENIIIYWDENKKAKVGFLNPINKQDVKSYFFASDEHRVKSINRSIKWAEFKQNMLINKYTEKYKSLYPGFRIR